MKPKLLSFLVFGLSLSLCLGGADAASRHAGTARMFPDLKLTQLASGLSSLVMVTSAGDGTNRLFLVEQAGRIMVFDSGALRTDPFLDIQSKVISGGERGLLALAFHPHYGTDGHAGEGKLYVYYSAPGGSGDHQSILAEYQVSDTDPNEVDSASERLLLTFDQPQSNHNGADLAFGPDDGMLYVSTGDGGGSNDSGTGHTANLGNAQDRTNLLGKILRIDVAGNNGPGGQYGIPAANPFVGAGGGVREEIFAYGLRNPFRMSFDDGANGGSSPDRLFVGDVGQGAFEEVDIITSGGNFGWRIREGNRPTPGISSPPDPGDLIEPIAVYENGSTGRSVIGGHVYRGTSIPDLVGKYIFGDFFNGRLFGLEESGGSFTFSILNSTPEVNGLTDVGVGEDGELYVTVHGGTLYRIDASGSAGGNGADTDGDGFPDDFETGVGTDAADANSTPNNNLPTGTSRDLPVAQAFVKLNFARSGTDLIKLRGTLPVAAGMDPSSQNVIVFFGGVTKQLQLDGRGRGAAGNDQFKVQIKRKKGEVQEIPDARFLARFKRGDFAADLEPEGLTNADVPRPGLSRFVRALIFFGGVLYLREARLNYVARQDRNGKGKGL